MSREKKFCKLKMTHLSVLRGETETTHIFLFYNLKKVVAVARGGGGGVGLKRATCNIFLCKTICTKQNVTCNSTSMELIGTCLTSKLGKFLDLLCQYFV